MCVCREMTLNAAAILLKLLLLSISINQEFNQIFNSILFRRRGAVSFEGFVDHHHAGPPERHTLSRVPPRMDGWGAESRREWKGGELSPAANGRVGS